MEVSFSNNEQLHAKRPLHLKKAQALQPPQILIATNNKAEQRILQLNLKKLGYSSLVASSCEETLEILMNR